MPAAKKQPGGRVDNRPQRELVVLPGGLTSVPDPDPKWLAETKREWVAVFGSAQAATLDGSTVPGIRRLFEMRDLQGRAWARYKKQPYVDGSQGQPVANPAFDEAMKLERAIVSLEDRYGLSLKALANLGVAVGQAKLTAAELNRMAEDGRGDSDGDDDWVDA
jgi:hypothetical protein